VLSAGATLAQEPPQALGELLIARGVSVDDTAASAGLTLLSGSRVKTSADGRAVLNLSGIGRVTMGPEAELYLTFSDRKIGGELFNGWASVNASKGVGVEFKTRDGLAVADGKEASSLRIDVTGGNTRVEAEGGAKVTSGEKSEFVAAGEEVEVSKESGLPVYARRALSFTKQDGGDAGFGSVLSVGLRGAAQEVTLDRTLVGPPTRVAGGGFTTVTGPETLRLTEVAQQVCGDPTPPCPPCRILPELVKAKAGCVVPFRVSIEGATRECQVSVRAFFFGQACFQIQPAFPQLVQIPIGGAATFNLNAVNCPRNANQFARNSLIMINTNCCGVRTVQVEWATPCR
jgi:hypothetical protein